MCLFVNLETGYIPGRCYSESPQWPGSIGGKRNRLPLRKAVCRTGRRTRRDVNLTFLEIKFPYYQKNKS
jgi:hypothetical protein